MKLSKEDARMVIWDDHEDFTEIESRVTSTTRWSIHNEGIYLHNPSGKHYKLEWSEGATEYQEEIPFEYNDPELIEVRPVSKTITAWEPVNAKASNNTKDC